MRKVLIVVVVLALAGGVVWGVRLLASESGTEEGSAVPPGLGPARTEPPHADLPETEVAAAVRASADSAAPAALVDSVAVMPAWCPAGRIVGRVVDASGRPIAGASVDALGPSRDETTDASLQYNKIFGSSPSQSSVPLVATARSGGDGLFELSHVFAGCPLLLRIDSPDGRNQLRAGLAALPGESLDLGDIALPDWSRVMGLVSDGTGRAIVGAQVMLGNPYEVFNEVLRRRDCDPLSPQPAKFLHTTSTGEDGTFTFMEVPPFQQEIAVFAPGYAPWTSFLLPKSGHAQSANVTLAPGLRISGTTVDEQGHPVPGASVHAQAESTELTCTTSDPEGRFELVELAAEQHTLHAFTDSASSVEVTADAGASGIELVLTPNGKSRGLDIQVLGATGSPAHDFELWGGSDDVASMIGAYAGLADGRVTLPFSFVLRGQLWALARGQSSPSIKLSSELLGQGPLCLRLQPSVPIEGRVIDAVTGAALAGAALDVRILDGVALQPNPTWCDQDGKFRIDYVPPGDVELRAMAAGHCDKVLSFGASWPRTVELALLPGGTLVLDANAAWRRERAVAHVRVISSAQRTLVDQDCSQVPCVLTGLEPGRYVIEIEIADASMRRSSSKGMEVEAAGITRIDLSGF